ncbi:hypothetical protein GPA10_39335 [Streptomyces sp. p1417]|uniref:DUF7691 domain-containing protein n=1 Tax=Streptomyces typhae TaxID=2681492 RepID=A0A6L6XAC4_9ACTN|nr:hypothetical protein [Streptomyces typhae]MVO90647.1 hypothetical protein [Streptomyces typhae]
MAEQYLAAFAVEEWRLRALVASRDEDLVEGALARLGPLREEGRLLRATDAAEVERALRALVAGPPAAFRADTDTDAGTGAGTDGYEWLLELLAPTLGEPVGSVVLPGRSWHVLEEAFRSWGLRALAELWGRSWTFPGTGGTGGTRAPDPWPFPMLAPRKDLEGIREELAAFDTGRVHDDYDLLPGGDDDVEDVVPLLEESFPAWIDAALRHDRDLLLIRDGGK